MTLIVGIVMAVKMAGTDGKVPKRIVPQNKNNYTQYNAVKGRSFRANGVLSHCFMPLNKSREGQLYLPLVAIHCFQTCTCLMGYIPHSQQLILNKLETPTRILRGPCVSADHLLMVQCNLKTSTHTRTPFITINIR